MGEIDFQREVLSMLTDIKADVAGVSERVARVEVVHVERCGAQGKRLDAIEERQKDHDEAIQELKEHQSFSKGQQAALVAAGTVVGAAAGVLAPHLFGGR